jgi:drug/metabolite transporter (DMT)-like permease
MSPPHAPSRPFTLLKAMALFLSAQVFFNLVDATGKYLVRDFPVLTVSWARYAFHLVFMAGYVALVWQPDLLATRRPRLQVVRGLTLVGFATFLFAALKYLPQAEAVAISFVAPLVILVLAGPLLGEHVGAARWAAAIAGFAGMLIVVRPGSGLAPLGVAFALATLACNAAFQLATRKLALTEQPIATVFYSAVVGTAGTTLLLPFGLPDHWPNAWQAALFLSFGVTGSVSHLLLIRAYRLAPASFIAPLIYGHIVMATVCGWLFFGQFPEAITLAGIAAIVASGAAIAAHETRRASRGAPVQQSRPENDHG